MFESLPSHPLPIPLAPTCGTCAWWLRTLLTLAATATFAHQLGVAPVFMAYTLFSVVMFGNTVPRFENLTVRVALITALPTPCALTAYAHCTLHILQEAMITLFAVLNGDVVRDTFMALLPHHPITGQVRANTKLLPQYTPCTVRATLTCTLCLDRCVTTDLHVHIREPLHLRRSQCLHCHH